MKLKYIYITIALFVVSFGLYGQANYVTWNFATSISSANYSTNNANQNTARSSALTTPTLTTISLNGSGINGTNANTFHRSTGWPTTQDNAKHLEFSITLTAGQTFNNTSLNLLIAAGVSNVGFAPRNYSVQYGWGSAPTFATITGTNDANATAATSGGTVTQLLTSQTSNNATIPAPGNTTSTILKIRLLAYGSTSSSGNIQYGSIALTAASLPATVDSTPPTLSTLSPLDNATSVSTTSNLALTFNENIVKGTGNILIKRSSDNTTFETIDVTSGLVTISGATAIINPSGTLANSTGYYVEIPNTAFKDAANNFYLGISGATAWNFTTAAADVTAPTVTALSPTDGATGVTTTSNLVLTFNENVVVGTAGNIVIYNSNNSVFETIPYNDARITFNGTTGVTINPTSTFANSASYYVQIGSSAIRDVAGNNYAGISNATDWNFTTVAASSCNELFISEYGEGTSNNKYIEIYNPTASTIDLSAGSYDIVLYVNGSATPATPIVLTGTVAANSTFLLQHNSATTGITANQVSGSLTFNGNDALALRKAMVLIDVIGQIGTDPGSEWGSGLNSTADNTLVRKSTIRTGDNNGSNAFDPSTEWDGFAVDTWTNIGTHESDCDTTPKITVSTTTLTGFSYATGSGPSAEQSFTVSGKNLLANLIVTPPTNYEISNTSGTGFVSSPSTLSFAPTSGIVTDKTIYVRLKSGLGVGTYSQDISTTSTSAATKNVTCSGIVLPPFYRSKQTGAWETASNWESSANNSTWATATAAPTNAVTAITILNTHNISISSGSVSADDITVATGGTLTISGGTFILNNGTATTDLQVNGTLTYSSGTFTQGSAGVAFSANATYNHAVVSTAIPIATWDVASNCVVTVIPPSTLNNIGQSYGNFTWNCTSQSTFFNINSNTFQVRGLFRVLSTGTQNLSMAGTTAGTYTNTINAAAVEGGIFAIAFSASVISTTTITNDFSISGGEVRINGASGTGTLNIGRDLLMSGTGYLNPLFLSNSLSTTITIARDLTMSGNSSINFESLDISGSATVINVGRNFTSTSAGAISDTIVLDFGGASTSGIVAGNALNIAGNFSFTGTGQMQTTSSNTPTGIVFNGAGTKTFTYTTPITLDWVPITINTGTTLQLQNSFSIGESAVAPVTTITVNGALDFQNHAITAFTSTVPRFNTNAGATLITANTAGIGGTGTTGSLRRFNNVAAATPANGKIVFLAGTNYTFNGATTTPFPAAFGNPATINVNAAITSNMTSGLTVTSAFNVNNGGTFTLNPTTNSLTLNNNAALTINTGGTFDNGGENQIFNGGGSPTINISGTFITKDVQGFVGDNTAIPGITPTLNTGSTIEYGFAGNQAVQGGRSYNNITISNGGTKALSSAITSGNTITGTVTIKDASILNVGDKTFGGAGTNLTMTGTAEYQTAGTGTKPDAEGTYDLGVGTKVSFTSGSIASPVATLQAIRISLPTVNYYNIDIVGNNVGTNATGTTGTNIKMQASGTFTVKSTGTFKHSNTAGFNGGVLTAIDNTDAPIITLESGSTIEYAGANQTITPFTNTIVPTPVYTDSNRSYSNLIVSGTGTKTIASNSEILVGNELLVTGGTVQIDSNKLLTVNNAIKNTSGSPILVKNSGNLVQVANVDNANGNNNTGNITMTRTSRNMPNVYDYIYWGSPVKGNVFSQIPSSVYDVSYYWKLTGAAEGFWDSLSTTSPGQGFISRVKTGGTGAKDFDFTGIPNNGTVLVAADGYDTDFNLDTTGNTILLANPYPCAINAEAFIDANGLLDGNLYFWTASTVPGDYYQQDDYATWNRSGSVGTKATTDSSGNDNLKPSGKIAAGQGFFADFHADGNVTFNNAMRIRTTNDNSQFFKTTKTNKVNQQKSRVWLNLSNTKKAFRQMLVAYLSNATNGFDRSYDAESFTGNEIDIYSIVENKSLVIQGRALPLDDADIVPVGIAITNAGEYNIAIDEVDGLMTNKAIYLEDKLLNKTHNLTEGAYTFTTASGTFNNRFVLRYTDATLGTKDPKLVENQVLVFAKDKKIKVNSAIENINTVTVYDLLGRQLFKNNKVNNKEFTLSNLVAKQQLLLVKVLLDNGETLSKKVLF